MIIQQSQEMLHRGTCLSYTIFIFPLFFYFDYLRLCDALASILCSLFHYQQPLSLHSPSSITCTPSILHHPHSHPPSSVSLSPLVSYFYLPTPCPFVLFYSYLLNIHSLLLASTFQLCLLNILSLVTLWVIFCILCTTLSLVVYKSFQLVIYSLACNCCSFVITLSPPSLPLVPYPSLLFSPLTIQSPCVSAACLLWNQGQPCSWVRVQHISWSQVLTPMLPSSISWTLHSVLSMLHLQHLLCTGLQHSFNLVPLSFYPLFNLGFHSFPHFLTTPAPKLVP